MINNFNYDFETGHVETPWWGLYVTSTPRSKGLFDLYLK
jgi:hypothetical protein